MDPDLQTCFDKWEASFDALCRYLLHTSAGVTRPVSASFATNELAITSEGMPPASSSSSASPSLSMTWENVSPVAPTSTVQPCSTECAGQAMPAISDFFFTDNRVTAPMRSSSDTGDLALASAGLGESAAPVPGIGEPLAVAPVVPVHTIAGLPASCSTDCAAQTITMSPSTLLPWVARSSTPASKSNGMVSTESIPDNEADEHGTSFDNGTVDVMPVLAAAAADGVTLDAAAAFCSWDCTAEVVKAPSTTPTSTTSPLLWASVISTKLCPENDDAEHGPLLTVAPARSSELAVSTMLSTSSSTEVGGVLPAAPVCIPWASTKPWLEPVPPHRPDLWSLFLGAWSFSQPPDSLGCTGGLLSPLRPCLPTPAPKPPWPLFGLEKLTGNGHPAFVIVSVHLLSEAKLATIVFPRESRIRAISADVQQWLLLTGIIGEWSCLIGSVKKIAPAVTYYGREELDLVNQYDSVVMLVELRPWIYSIVMNFFELACLQNGQENSGLLQLLGTLSSSVSCGMAKDQYNARAKWSFSDLLLRVHEWAPTIQSVQHACVTSALYLHEQYTNGILVQELVNCSVLTLFSSASLYSFWVPDLLEGANKLKCTKTAQGLTGEHLVEAALSQDMRVCCLLGSLYQEEHGSRCNKLLPEAKLTDTIGGLFMDHHSRYNSFSPGTYFGVEWLNGILLQDYLLFQFIGHVIQCGFELLQWEIAWLRQLQCSEIPSHLNSWSSIIPKSTRQSKPPWLPMQIKLGTKAGEGGVYPRRGAKPCVQMILLKLLLQRPYSELSIDICLHDLQLTRSGTEARYHSFCESTNRPLMQASRIPHDSEKMQLCVGWELLTLQTHGHGWIYQGFVLLSLHTNLLSTQDADEHDIITRKHHRVLVRHTKAPWDPGGSTWCQWFSSGDNQVPFQGVGRTPAIGPYKELCFPWDPGGAPAAWGQAAFQGGRDVRDPSVMGLGWASSVMGLGPIGNQTQKLQVPEVQQRGNYPSWITNRRRRHSLSLPPRL